MALDQQLVTLPLTLAIWLIAGIGAGIAYFGTLWWSARQFGQDCRLTIIVALALLRLAALGSLLVLASFQGAGPLLAMALGVAAARFGVTHRLRGAMP
jgi:F1F0 ATPase subunit 2